MASRPFFFDVPKCSMVQIANADASNKKTVITAAANGTKVSALWAASDDTSARTVTVYITRSGTSYPIGAFSVTIGAGTTLGVPHVNLLDPALMPGLPYDNDGNPYLFLVSGDTLQVASGTTVTSGKFVTCTAIHSDDA